MQFDDQISVSPAGLEYFYLPTSQRQIKNNRTLRSPRLYGEKMLLQIRHRNYE